MSESEVNLADRTGDLESAADSWNLFGQNSSMNGKLEAAKAWSRKKLATRLVAGGGAGAMAIGQILPGLQY